MYSVVSLKSLLLVLSTGSSFVCLKAMQEVQGGGAGDYGILDTDPEFSLIINNAKQMAACAAAFANFNL